MVRNTLRRARKAMWTTRRESPGHRTASGTGGFPLHPAAGQPSLLPKAEEASTGGRSRRRRTRQRGIGGHPPAERAAARPVPLADDRQIGLQREPVESANADGQPVRPNPEAELRAHEPWRSTSQEVSPVLRRGLGYFLKVQLDPGLQRGLDLHQQGSGNRDVEIHADRFPRVPGTERIAAQVQGDRLSVEPGFVGQLGHLGRLPHWLDPETGRGSLETT